MQKILIIRLSSIGDIVLTSPVVRCVKLQTNAKIHFLTKSKYASIIESNPYVDKIIVLENTLKDTLKALKNERYNYIIDLHNNLKSFLIKINLGLISYTIKKESWKKYLLIYFKFNLLKDHVVERYFKTIKNIHIINDNQGLDYFLNKDTIVDFNVNQNFIAWAIGSSYNQKSLSEEQIINVCNSIAVPVVLLGGFDEQKKGTSIVSKLPHSKIYNFCGKLSLDQSAYLTKHSNLVLTNDTGLMHIASAFHKPILSFWGCTKPILGFSSYMNKSRCVNMVINPKKEPCSKHGNYCKIDKSGCVKHLNYKSILKIIKEFDQRYVIP